MINFRKVRRELHRICEQVNNYFPYILIWYWKRWRNQSDGVVAYLSLPMHYAAFENIHRYLPEVTLIAANSEVADYLQKRNIPYSRNRLYPQIVIMADYFQQKYPVSLIKKVQIFHGVGCKNYFYGRISRDQYCLVPGEAWAAKLQRLGVRQLAVIGYPKTDKLFADCWDKEELLRKYRCSPGKRTILFAPTWAKFSSAPKLKTAIGKLAQSFNVLVKLHDNSSLEWRQDYQNIPGVIYCEEADATSYLYVADLLISDFSSIIFEFAQLYRPIVVFGISKDELSANAPDPAWWDVAVMVDNAEMVESTVTKLLDGTWQPNESYRRIVNSIFAYRDGRCGKRAAEIMRAIMTQTEEDSHGSDYSCCGTRK